MIYACISSTQAWYWWCVQHFGCPLFCVKLLVGNVLEWLCTMYLGASLFWSPLEQFEGWQLHKCACSPSNKLLFCKAMLWVLNVLPWTSLTTSLTGMKNLFCYQPAIDTFSYSGRCVLSTASYNRPSQYTTTDTIDYRYQYMFWKWYSWTMPFLKDI